MIKNAKSDTPDDLAKLRRSPQAEAYWQNVQRFLLNGRYANALAGYRTLTQQFPGVSQLWAELGLAAAGELDFALADQASLRAAELASGDATLLVSIGQQYHRLRRLEQARACFERAVEADPSSVHARLSLAAWLERDRYLDKAWECVEACLLEHPNDGRALYYKAFLLHRKGLDAEAETALRDLIKRGSLDPNVNQSAHHLLGVVLDALGQHAEAIRWLGGAKLLLSQMTNIRALEATYDQADRARHKLLAELTPETLRRWREESTASPSPHSLAFLGGPPRSGTTLVEQILASHPQILAFDEPEGFVQEVVSTLHPAPPARGLTFKSLNALTATARSRLIGRYFKSLLRDFEQGPHGRLLLDKNPSLTASLHIWLRLFPQLKVIITLRDPRDIIISCYFQNLQLTPANVNFLSLERTARFYADCMDVWLRLRELGGFDWIETRYEDVVANLEVEGRRMTKFLGLPWHEAQANYHETARRNFVNAPTYNEVTKPVYNTAVGRWKNYAKAVAPLQEHLAKYCQAFGYD
ncbi:MAG: sulfotransferase [Verrucomicrobiota bacterium]|jgi:Tfp pilus assembly protein PilF